MYSYFAADNNKKYLNGELDDNSKYAVFQRSFADDGEYESEGFIEFTTKKDNTVAIVVGVLVSVLLVVVIVVGIFIYRRRKRRHEDQGDEGMPMTKKKDPRRGTVSRLMRRAGIGMLHLEHTKDFWMLLLLKETVRFLYMKTSDRLLATPMFSRIFIHITALTPFFPLLYKTKRFILLWRQCSIMYYKLIPEEKRLPTIFILGRGLFSVSGFVLQNWRSGNCVSTKTRPCTFIFFVQASMLLCTLRAEPL